MAMETAWIKLMGLGQAAFNRNFFITILLVLLAYCVFVTSMYFEVVSALEVKNKEIIESEIRNSGEKQLLNDQCDSAVLRITLHWERKYDNLTGEVFKNVKFRK
jgi:hypothetical protein